MNLNLATLPLPSMSSSRAAARRRHCIGNLELDNRALRRFQHVADSLQSECATPDSDALATAARSLARRFAGTRRAPCIQLRLRCLAAMRAMSNEAEWTLEPAKLERIALIAGYAANEDRLIPDDVPVVGGLDDAVLVELAWPSLRGDLDDYLSFRRLRIEEALLCGVHPHEMRYGREQWIESRAAERALFAHARHRGCESYAGPTAPSLFRFHG